MNNLTQSHDMVTINHESASVILSGKFSPAHVIKEHETAKQMAKRLEREKRKATNEAGQIMAKAINSQRYNLKVILSLFANETREESTAFCAALSKETGKSISVDAIVKMPMRNYLDYIKEIEAARGLIRGGITPAEFKNALTRYYRGEKVATFQDADKELLATIYTHGAE